MTEDQKCEIALLARELERKRAVYEMHATMNAPTHPAACKEAMIAYAIAQTEYLEAGEALRAAQARIAGIEAR